MRKYANKLNRNVHGSVRKENATNVCVERFVSHVNHSDDNVPVTPKVNKESNKLNLHEKGINVSHLNVQSLLSSIDKLRLWLKDNPYHVFTLSEIWLGSTDSEIQIPRYVFERFDHTEMEEV